MANITISEWSERTQDLAKMVRLRWPWFDVVAEPHSVIIRSSVCSATVGLENDDRHFRPGARFGSASGLMGSVGAVRHGAAEYLQVCDALDLLTAHTEALHIWSGGECPCDSCSGRGRDGVRPCKRCDGKGVR